jgi:ABC-type multidrug transport system fused ATPase/permease subunit
MVLLAWRTYIKLADALDKIMTSVTNNEKFIEHNSEFYYNLRKPSNLDYFLTRLVQEVVNTDTHSFYRATIFFAFIMDVILIMIALIRLFFVSTTINTLTILLFVDIAILSVIVIGFLIIVAYINQKITTDTQQLLKRTITETTEKLICIRAIKVKAQKDIDDEKDLENSITYLSAMSNYIVDEREKYCIKLYYFLVVDLQLVRSVAFSALVGLASTIFAFIHSKSLLASHFDKFVTDRING